MLTPMFRWCSGCEGGWAEGPDIWIQHPLVFGQQVQGPEDDAANLRRYWSMVTRLEPGGVEHVRRPLSMAGQGVSVGELKRIIELQPLEMPAAAAVASRLALLNPPQFSALLGELARDNHAFR